MTICTYNARTVASEAAIEDLMMQAKKIKYDVIGLIETRRRHPLNAVYETGEEVYNEEAFYMDLEKFYREDHAFYKVIIADFNANYGWPKKNSGGTSHRDPRPTMERPGGEALRAHHDD
ncbi:hypothetical protein RB195_011609 [Necator americanus]|uniref:Endonuclease/exonuclease/phosphatase domain-containing protein n=1 Tax=Necator americanus TaxID=51031 RepID=A0ABR1D431_NECAM